MRSGAYRVLTGLIDGQSVPYSEISSRTQRQIQPLLDAGALTWRKRGRGMVLEAHDAGVLRAFMETHYPHGEEAPSSPRGGPLPPRAEAVALHRDAKHARVTTAEPVLVRALTDATASRGEHTVALLDLTRRTGAACLLVDDAAAWHLDGTIALVENLEPFLHFEHLGTRATVSLYAGGRLSGRVLDWLASEAMASCDYLHCGDYDPVGIDELLRLREKLGDRVALYVPPSVDLLFRRYGKRDLLRNSAAVLARLRDSTDPDIRGIVELMDATGCGLEQEALLLG